MKIILLSLFTNALFFRDPQQDGNGFILRDQKENQFEIVVSDDGEGIDLMILLRIFEMFFRGSERSVGNGLGLYIARKAVEKLDRKPSCAYCFRFNPIYHNPSC